MSHIKSEKLLDVAVEASLAASDLIMEALQKPKTSNHKGTTDLVTATDLESEKIIKAIIDIIKTKLFFTIFGLFLIFFDFIICFIYLACLLSVNINMSNSEKIFSDLTIIS